MQNHSEYTTDTFIARWIAGELTENEINGLNQFMQQEPGAIQYFEEIKKAWFGVNPHKLPKGLSSKERWTRLKQKLNLKTESKNGKN